MNYHTHHVFKYQVAQCYLIFVTSITEEFQMYLVSIFCIASITFANNLCLFVDLYHNKIL